MHARFVIASDTPRRPCSDVGIGKDGKPKDSFSRGMELRARVTLFGEGCRGSCSESLMKKFNLREVWPCIARLPHVCTWSRRCRVDMHWCLLCPWVRLQGKDPQHYGLGIKEVWQIPESKARPGFIQHTIGYPLSTDMYGGSFLYHMAPNYIQIGLVVGLDYPNPYVNPYMEFQRLKHHPAVAKHLEGGECVQYGARCINEGGFQVRHRVCYAAAGVF